uniref:Uncharacterized protein n=1 Tax=Leersia perrieri TaxID=77586 RepID=A0A0D9WRF9_9ORYZ
MAIGGGTSEPSPASPPGVAGLDADAVEIGEHISAALSKYTVESGAPPRGSGICLPQIVEESLELYK